MDDSAILKVLSENLKATRAELNYSIKKFCVQCGVPQGTMETYLYGKSILPLDTLVAICDSLNISINPLFDGLVDFQTEQTFIDKIIYNFDRIPIERRNRVLDLIEPIISSMVKGPPHLNNAKLGQRIRILRQELGFSVDKVAKDCNIEPVTLRCLESNQFMPGIPIFLKLCEVLKASPEYLLCNHVNLCSLASDKRYYNLLPCHLEGIALTSDRFCSMFNG